MESKNTHNHTNNTIKFLCSYGGKILPRPIDGMLRYAGGHTRVLAVHPSISFSDLMVKLAELCGSSSVTLRCALPDGDLETLISVKSDEDLANVIEEYEKCSSSLPHPLKIRAILSPPKTLQRPFHPPSSSPSSAAHSPPGSSHSSSGSQPYSPPQRFFRPNFPTVGYPIGVRNGSCWCRGQFDGSPRFNYRRPHSNYYCH